MHKGYGSCFIALFQTPPSAFQHYTQKSEGVSSISGGFRGGSRVSTEPPFWLDLVLRSTDDRANGIPLPDYGT